MCPTVFIFKKWKQPTLKMKTICNTENASDIILNEISQMQTILMITTTMKKYACK